MAIHSKKAQRIRKQKARQRAEAAGILPSSQHLNGSSNPKSGLDVTSEDSNTTLLLPLSSEERQARKVAMREQLRSNAPETKINAKKRKRLDKYIDVKMRKQENAEVMKKLAAMEPVNTSLMRSSKKLGRGEESKRELLKGALERKRRGVAEEGDEELLVEERTVREMEDIADEVSEKQDTPSHRDMDDHNSNMICGLGTSVEKTVSSNVIPAFGSGLKRPLELDDQGRPMIKRRRREDEKSKRNDVAPTPAEQEGDETEWEGFSDSSEKGINEEGEEMSETSDGDDDTESTDDTSMEEEGDTVARTERKNAFTAWATQSRNEALGFVSTNVLDSLPARTFNPAEGEKLTNELQEESAQRVVASALPKVPELAKDIQNVFSVAVYRTPEIEQARLALPVVAEEQKIMEAIHANDMVIICGATGSGKTTQVPQFLLEAGYGDPKSPTPGMIGVTQPRRVAAVSMAKRVAVELGDAGSKVSHQIRFNSTVDKSTAIKFMTDGVLLREVGQDFILSKYSAIVLDEAHERSVNTDILIGMLSRIVETRARLAVQTPEQHTPLKLVIMSATLGTTELLENKTLFRGIPPPIIEAAGRQHTVTDHFAKKTERDYLDQAFRKICQGHQKLPPGAMLVFLTGQNEIFQLAKQLREVFPSTDGGDRKVGEVRVSAAENAIEDEDVELGHQAHQFEGENDVDEYESDAEIRGLDDDNDEDGEFDVGEGPEVEMKIHILPLYAQLPAEQQMRVFEPAPEGSRLIILATNVAETSLTIPGVRYVFDGGRAKEKQYDEVTGVQSFGVSWISKASANQRKGRAGRTGPGHCYKLYSSAVFERDFKDFTEPEIARTPVEGIVLQLKSMGIPKVANFPFPTPPDRTRLIKAEKLLGYLGALVDGKVTDLGKELALYPLSPRLARILRTAQKLRVIEPALSMVAAMSVGEIFKPEPYLPDVKTDEWTEESNREEQRKKDYDSFHGNLSRLDRSTDAFKLLLALQEYSSPSSSKELFQRYTHPKALNEALQLRQQLATIVSTHTPTTTFSSALFTTCSKQEMALLTHTVASGYIDQIAQRADASLTPPTAADGRSNKPKRAIDVPYIALFPAHSKTSTSSNEDDVDPENIARRKYIYIHPSSVLAHLPISKLPQYLIYSHLSSSSSPSINSTRLPRTRLHPLTPVTPTLIVSLARGTPLLEDGKPVGKIEMLARGEDGCERRSVWTVPFLVPGTGSGGVGWPMPPAVKVVQKRIGAKGWVVEREVEGE